MVVLLVSVAIVVFAFRDQLFSGTTTVVNTPLNQDATTNTTISNANQNTNSTTNVTTPVTLTNRNVNTSSANTNTATNTTNTNATTNTNVNTNANTNTATNATDQALARDSDGDNLTAAEEQLWGTNPTFADTDGDGFLDGQEIAAGYSPVRAAVALEVGEEIEQFANNQQGYTISYPGGMSVRAVDDAGADIILTTPTGEYVEVTAQANAASLSAAQWYQKLDPTVSLASMRRVRLAGVEAVISKDGRSIYLPHAGKMLTFTYVLGNEVNERYKTTFVSIYSSITLRTPGTTTNTNASANTNTATNTTTTTNTNTNTATTVNTP